MQPLEFTKRIDLETAGFFLDVHRASIEIPEHVQKQAEAACYTEKTKPHITIIGRKVGAQLLKIGYADQALEQAATTDWHPRLLPVYHVLRKLGENEVKCSLIQMVALPELNDFYKTMNADTGLQLPTPPPHMTLFTHADSEGIGLYSWDDLDTHTHETLL